VIGAMFATGIGGVYAGGAYLFERDAGGPDNWGEVQMISASNGLPGDAFGRSVCIAGDTLVVGCPYGQDNGKRTGTGYVFERVGGVWLEVVELFGSLSVGEDRFGTSTFLAGDTVISGAWQGGPGLAYVFERDAGGPENWGETARLTASNGTNGARFGGSVATSGAIHLVGASAAAKAYAFEPNPQLPTSYCTAGLTSNGCTARMSATGNASATASSGFTLVASGVEGGKLGLIFYGVSGPSATPWGLKPSFKCVASPVQRTPLQAAGGTVGLCDGVLTLDWNAFVSSRPKALGGPFTGGETVWAQCIFRDPPIPPTTSMSDAMVFSLCP